MKRFRISKLLSLVLACAGISLLAMLAYIAVPGDKPVTKVYELGGDASATIAVIDIEHWWDLDVVVV